MKERAISNIFGMPFRHVPACARCTLLTYSESSMVIIISATGFSLLFWRKAINMMLLKSSKFIRVNKLFYC